MEFMIDSHGILWAKIEGSEAYASTGFPCEEGHEQEVWDSIPDGTGF